jgi:uncharacterized phage-associated protein
MDIKLYFPLYNPNKYVGFRLRTQSEGATMINTAVQQTKALAAVLYIANKLGIIDFHKLCKLLYLADKRHLELYGRMITKDCYEAMIYGPVPKDTYSRILSGERKNQNEEYGFRVVGQHSIEPFTNPDLDQLSLSDVECLAETIEKYGAKSFDYLTRITHDSAWQAGRKRSGFEILLDDIIEVLPNAGEIKNYLSDAHL